MFRAFIAAVYMAALACPAVRAQNLENVKNPKVHKAFSDLESAFGSRASEAVPTMGKPRARVKRGVKMAHVSAGKSRKEALNVPLQGVSAVRTGAGNSLGGLLDKAKSEVSGLGDKWRNGNVQTKLNIVAGGAAVLGGGLIVGALLAPEAAGTLAIGGLTSIAVGAGIHYSAPLFQRVQDGLSHLLPGS
ncbi:MAG: hypothetical protein KGL04_08295 [Elusimicrobia bacterium]|nr:hypothetical protein [Elusimicrobiota bacterium]